MKFPRILLHRSERKNDAMLTNSQKDYSKRTRQHTEQDYSPVYAGLTITRSYS